MNESCLRMDGVVTCWSSGSFYALDKLKDGFAALGLADLAPGPSTYDANLKYALGRVFSSSVHMIRPNKGGFNIYEEQKGEKDEPNEFNHRFTFWLDGQEHNQLRMNPVNRERGQEVAAAFNEFCGLVTQASVTRSLVSVVSKFQGIPIRPTGGVYWLPAQAIPLWKELGLVIEGAAHFGTAAVYLIQHSFDADSIRAVRDALVADAEREAKRIESECMQEGELGAKALESRKQQANEQLEKLELYESLLGTTLEEIKLRLGSVRDSAAVAALRAAAAKYEGATP